MIGKRKLNFLKNREISSINDLIGVQSGIYFILNNISKKVYIGSSKNIYYRFISHRKELRLKTHRNKPLQKSWDKYGEESFSYGIIEELPSFEENRDNKELYWIEYFNSWVKNNGYNIRNPKYHGNMVQYKRAKYKDNPKAKWPSCNCKDKSQEKFSDHLRICPNRKKHILRLAKINNDRYKGGKESLRKQKDKTRMAKYCRDNFGKPICKIDIKTNNIIDIYETLSDADKANKADFRNLSACCKGKQKTAYGFKWKYLEDVYREQEIVNLVNLRVE